MMKKIFFIVCIDYTEIMDMSIEDNICLNISKILHTDTNSMKYSGNFEDNDAKNILNYFKGSNFFD